MVQLHLLMVVQLLCLVLVAVVVLPEVEHIMVQLDKVALVARYLQAQTGFYLLIEGHCDERGTEQYNLSLGQRRAQSVRDTLMKFGINPERVQTISFGEKVPVIESNDKVSYQENRRGEFVVYRPSLPSAPKPKTPVVIP